MKKIHLQNLIAVLDRAISKGIILPDEVLDIGLSRAAALTLLNTLVDNQDIAGAKTKQDQPSEAGNKN